MDFQPSDVIFAITEKSLSIQEILSLATTNQYFNSILNDETLLRQLALKYGFPYGVNLVELKAYENMLLEDRLQGCAKTGDIRVFWKLVELCDARIRTEFPTFRLKYNPYINTNELAIIAAKYSQYDFLLLMMEFGADNYDDIGNGACQGGDHYDDNTILVSERIIDLMIEKGGDNFYYFVQGLIEAKNSHHILRIFDKIRPYFEDFERESLYIHILNSLVKIGDSNAISKFLQEIEYPINEGEPINPVNAAAEGGHYDIFLQMFEYEGKILRFTYLKSACKGGNRKIIQYLIDAGCRDYNYGFEGAIDGNHLDIAKEMYYASILLGLYMNLQFIAPNTLEATKFLIQCGSTEFNATMDHASYIGNIEIVKYMLQKGADNLNSCAARAAGEGHNEIVKLLVEHGANDYFAIFRSVIQSMNVEMLIWSIKKILNMNIPSEEYNGMLLACIEDDHNLISINLLLELGATDYDEALSSAVTEKQRELIRSYMNK